LLSHAQKKQNNIISKQIYVETLTISTCDFPRGKMAGAWSWPLTSIYCRGQEYVELYHHSPNKSS